MDKSDFWNERYSQGEYVYGTSPNDFLVESLNHIPQSGKVLCIGDGEGRNSVWLAQKGFSVTSIDMSREGRKKALSLAEKNRVSLQYIVGDLGVFEFGVERWDAIVSIFCHLPNALRQKVFANCFKALKPNGIFLLEAYAPQQLSYGTGGPKELDMLVDLKSIKQEFDGFELLVEESRERHVAEGTFHHGLAYVTRIIAKKR